MDFPYSLPLLLRKQIKVLKVHYRKYNLLRGRLLVWCLNPLNVVLSLAFIGVLEGHSRLTRPAWWSLAGQVGSQIGIWDREAWWSRVEKHGGMTSINLGKSQPPP
ncbi:unnamed protein product [Prunus armeniaca]